MFYEKRTKRAWYGSTSSDVCWEQWAITINIVTNVNEKGMGQGSAAGDEWHVYVIVDGLEWN